MIPGEDLKAVKKKEGAMYRVSLLLIASLFAFSLSAVSAQETSGPLVELKNQYSGKCLTVKDGSTKHGAALIHKECAPGGLNAVWEMRPEGAGYRIVNRNSGLCLGVEHQSKKDGMRVTQVSPCTRADTLWKVENVPPAPSQRNPLTPPVDYGKTVVIRNSNSNKCLALVTGDEIKQYGCPPHRVKTTWQFVEPPSSASAQITGRPYITDFEKHLMPFYCNGKTYLFGLSSSRDVPFAGEKVTDNAANWWVINDDPKTGFTPVVQRAKMSSAYMHLASFTLNHQAYIFGLHRGKEKAHDYASVGANIWRINDDPSTGFKLVLSGGKMSWDYRHVVSFQLKGEPYIFGLHNELGANIWRIKEGPKGLTMELVKYKAKMSPNYHHLEVFYMDGHPYIFGVHTGESRVGSTGSGVGVGANIWRIKDDPSQGLDLVMYGEKAFPHSQDSGYDFVKTFHINGRPYIFAAVLDELNIPTDVYTLAAATALSLIFDDWSYFGQNKGYMVIWEISGDPSKPSIKRITPKAVPISNRYKNMITFEQGGKAYVFGIHKEGYANIWRVADDPTMGYTLDYYGRNK